MKRLLVLTLCFLALGSFASAIELVRSDDNNQLWRLSKKGSSYLTITRKLNSKAFTFEGMDYGSFLKKLEDDKRKVLSLMGIKDWKVSQHSWTNTTDGKRLSLKGNYRDRKGIVIYFIEEHQYRSKAIVQALLTKTSNIDSKEQSLLKEKLDAFIKNGGVK